LISRPTATSIGTPKEQHVASPQVCKSGHFAVVASGLPCYRISTDRESCAATPITGDLHLTPASLFDVGESLIYSFTPRPMGWSGGRQPSLTRLRDFGLARLDALAEIFGCGFGRPDSCNENEKPRPHWNDRGEVYPIQGMPLTGSLQQ
jgi:hypothetical protein